MTVSFVIKAAITDVITSGAFCSRSTISYTCSRQQFGVRTYSKRACSYTSTKLKLTTAHCAALNIENNGNLEKITEDDKRKILGKQPVLPADLQSLTFAKVTKRPFAVPHRSAAVKSRAATWRSGEIFEMRRDAKDGRLYPKTIEDVPKK